MFLSGLFGVLLAQVGINITHDASHFTCSRSNVVCRTYACALDLVGWSSFMWSQQHVVGHHCYTNVGGVDPDIRVADPDVRRITPEQSPRPYYVCGTGVIISNNNTVNNNNNNNWINKL